MINFKTNNEDLENELCNTKNYADNYFLSADVYTSLSSYVRTLFFDTIDDILFACARDVILLISRTQFTVLA